MIKINDDIRRVLKHLLTMNGVIEIKYDGYITEVIFCSSYTRFTVTKCEYEKEYFITFINFLDIEKEGQPICFTTQSSVINFLKNNVK